MLTLNVIRPNTIDLSHYTVEQLKNWAKENNLKAPSGLKKADLIEYLTGAYSERASGLVKEAKYSTMALDVLQPRHMDFNVDWLTHLHTHGWAVAPIPEWDPNFTDTFLSWFESCSPNFNKRDHTTWKAANMPTMLHGILKHYFGHTELQWSIRELCVPIFARIWNCAPEDLLCSFDGGCFLPAIPKDNLKNSSFKNWIHNDQDRNQLNFASVQGVINFEENGPEDGGLILVERSHTIFTEYMSKHPSEGIVWGPSDMGDPLLSSKPLVKICAPPGSIILFDSRTFHANVHPYGSILKEDNTPRFRMCTYVSMQPRSGATQKELTKRITLYEKGRMTGHNCFGHYFKGTAEHPRIYGGINNRPPTIEIAPLNSLRRRLVGYE